MIFFFPKWLCRWEPTSSLGPSHKLLFYVLFLWWLSCLFCLGWDGRGGSRHVLTWHCWVLGERGDLAWPCRFMEWGDVRIDEEGRFTIEHFCMSHTRSLLTGSGWPVTLQECRETEKCESSSRHRLKKTCRHMHLDLYRQIELMWCFKEWSG